MLKCQWWFLGPTQMHLGGWIGNLFLQQFGKPDMNHVVKIKAVYRFILNGTGQVALDDARKQEQDHPVQK